MISVAELAEYAENFRLVPIARTLFADGETPVGVYRKLAGDADGRYRPGTFLLESAEPGRSFSRWSFIGVSALAMLSIKDGVAAWSGAVPSGVPRSGEPLALLGETWRALTGPRLLELPPLTGGLVGYLGYDLIRYREPVPANAIDELLLPQAQMLLVTDLAAVDHFNCTVTLVATVVVEQGMSADQIAATHADAVRRLDQMQAALQTSAPATLSHIEAVPAKAAKSRTAPGDFQRAVRSAITAVQAGEVFQIVPSQRFTVQTTASPLNVYRMLRTLNPSSYMYLLHLEQFDIVGSSPEALVTVQQNEATIHPIAGSRPRGETAEHDAELVCEMVNDPKERAEHVMLVDLARNDLGRVCAPGTVKVVEFGAVERYSRVSHIVSTVRGELAAGKDAFDAFLSAFPHGTVTGAPKVRAMQLIDELEPVQRGVYAGALGYMAPTGDIDLAICIRTAVMRDGVAYVQAGAGVVADSVPDLEEAETRHKAGAVLQAIASAEQL